MKVRKLSFQSGSATLYAEMFLPDEKSSYPIIVMTHGLSGIVSMDLRFYAERFVEKGLACFIYDHRNWGMSSGWPRCETDPWRQVLDMREAISFVKSQPESRSSKIGLWGTSYSGGHVLTVGALDSRVSCIVSQVPLISGSRTFENWVPLEKRKNFIDRMMADFDARSKGSIPITTKAAVEGSETAEWVKSSDKYGEYVNEITLRTFDLIRTYEPLQFVDKIVEKPVALIVADSDTQTPTAWQLEAFEKISTRKKLYSFDCRHYDVYLDRRVEAANSASEWFEENLLV